MGRLCTILLLVFFLGSVAFFVGDGTALGSLEGGGWIVFPGDDAAAPGVFSRDSRRRTGGPQLVSIEPLPVAEGEMCQWLPASGSTMLAAVLRQERRGAASAEISVVNSESRVAEVVHRVRILVNRDTYPTYSAIAVDLNTHEVFLQDENLFGIKVFDRLDHTPPSAAFTEPKRSIEGDKTKLEFNCAIYVDPKTGDVYSVSNDTVDTMVVFPRNAQGDVEPIRELETPHRTYGIAVDEKAEELFLTIQYPPEVIVYRKMASGAEEPLRTLAGSKTQLEDPHGIAVDTKNQLLYVSNHGSSSDTKVPGSGRFEPPSLTVYPLQAAGDRAPVRILEGPKTQLNWPSHLFVDEELQELYVANDMGDSILVFRATDNGDVAPIRVIGGSKTGIKNPTGIFVDFQNDEVWVANMGNHSATVFPRAANGNVAPLRVIRSAPAGKLALVIGNPGAAAYDSKRDEILVPN